MMNNRVCYRKIRTYTDLRIERMRVDRELDSLGERLKADWRGISQMFSMGYLVDRVTGPAARKPMFFFAPGCRADVRFAIFAS